MKKLFHRLLPLTGNVFVAFLATLVIGFVVMPVGFAFAQASTKVDVSPLINNELFWQIVGAVVTTVVGWLATRVATYFHLSSQANIRDYVVAAAKNGVFAIQAQLANKPVTIDVHDQSVAAVANHLIATVPDGLKKLGFKLDAADPALTAFVATQVKQYLPPPAAASAPSAPAAAS
jgi:hypothetical protein